MNTDELIRDAEVALDILKSYSPLIITPAFKQAAARQLADIAAQLQSAVSMMESEFLDVRETAPESKPRKRKL